MKRFLKNNQHQLSMREQEDNWRAIQDRSGRGEPQQKRRFMLPAFGMTAATAVVLLAVIWFGQPDAPEKIMGGKVGLQQQWVDQITTREVVPLKPEGTLSESEAIESVQQPATATAVEEDLEFQTVPEPEPKVKEVTKSGVKGNPTGKAPDPAPGKNESPSEANASTEYQTFDHYAIEPVAEALEKEAGVVSRAGELHVRGGRSGELTMQIDGAGVARDQAQSSGNIEYEPEPKKRTAATPEIPQVMALAEVPPPPAGSVTGGTTAPNGEKYELMYHEHAGVNPFIATEEDALSTFAVDVDNASYTLMRGYLEAGALPPADAIRVEEFVNYFGGGYPRQTKDVFAIHTDGSQSRFGQGYQLLRVGLQGMDIDASERKPANLIFVIDISGSMARENRLGMVKQSLHTLLGELGEGDRVAIVVYGNRGEVVLKPTDISQRERIAAAIDRLGSGGATNACEGLEVAYELARKHYDAGLVNRIVLCSDGVANMGGATRAEEMLAKVRRSSDQGVTLSTIGFGMGNYNDVLMEKLANQGDGNYFYVDKLAESERVFKQNLTGLLQTIARQVKIQVEFDPDQVQRWRLLGYENRDVADRDFRNDNVDAGEVGAGHQVTALYELKLKNERRPSQLDDDFGFGSDQLGTVRVRYEYPAHDTARAGQVREIEKGISRRDVVRRFDQSDRHLRLQVVAAEFAEILRRSFWAKESSLGDLNLVARSLAAEFTQSEANGVEANGGQADGAKAQELARLIGLAADLEAAQKAREVPNLER